jgi:hypothetical protein
MSKRAPSTAQLLVIAGFALSCFGILLFLWITFGGPTPFKAKPYEVKIPFSEATQLAEQSDVRISGVSVGKVQGIALAPNGKQALATVDVDDRYAPLPRSTRAILRTKTLLGETYVELTPGNRNGPKLADGGTLPTANVAQSVQLDEIFRTFDARTRAAFQTWMQEASVAIGGRGQSLSNALGEFEPTFTEFDKLFRVLDTQRVAVSQPSATAPSRSRPCVAAKASWRVSSATPTRSSPPPPGGIATSKRSSAPSRPSSTSRGLPSPGSKPLRSTPTPRCASSFPPPNSSRRP